MFLKGKRWFAILTNSVNLCLAGKRGRRTRGKSTDSCIPGRKCREGDFQSTTDPEENEGGATKSSKKHNVRGYILSAAHLPRHPAT